MQKQPKFKVGDKVHMKKKTLYNETLGEITKVERIYQSLDHFGDIDPHGLCTRESDIKSICLPYRFDGEKLEVDYPEHDYGSWIEKAKTRVAIFNGYSYTVKTPKMNTIYSEKALTKI